MSWQDQEELFANRGSEIYARSAICAATDSSSARCRRTCRDAKRIASLLCIVVKHSDCIEGVVAQIHADQSKFFQNIWGGGNDVTSHRLGLKNIEQFPGTGPDELRVGTYAHTFDSRGHHWHRIDA